MYRELNKSCAQILVEEDLLTRSVRHSNPSIHILVGKSNSQLFEGRTCFGGDLLGTENRRLSASGFDTGIECRNFIGCPGETCVVRRRRYRLSNVRNVSVKEPSDLKDAPR